MDSHPVPESRRKHLEEVREWLRVNVNDATGLREICIVNLAIDWERFPAELTGHFDIEGGGAQRYCGFRFKVSITGKAEIGPPMFGSPLGAPASYAAVDLTDAAYEAMSRALRAILPPVRPLQRDQTVLTPIPERVPADFPLDGWRNTFPDPHPPIVVAVPEEAGEEEDPSMEKGMRDTDTYLRAMGFPGADPERKRAIASALDRAHDLRKFEIESYWKRSQYIWLFQASAITLAGLIYTRSSGEELLLLASGIGAITAQVGWLTARGAKFWQSNWEAHIDRLEPFVEGKLTQTVLYQSGGVRSSISRISERLYALFFIVWISLFALIALTMAGVVFIEPERGHISAFAVAALTFALGMILFRTRSSLNPSAPGSLAFWRRLRAPARKGPLAMHDRASSES